MISFVKLHTSLKYFTAELLLYRAGVWKIGYSHLSSYLFSTAFLFEHKKIISTVIQAQKNKRFNYKMIHYFEIPVLRGSLYGHNKLY